MTEVIRTSTQVDNLANALRNEDNGAFACASAAAACFLPLLRELAWDGDDREVIETLPHFADNMDLVDLRGVLALLGYHSEPEKTRFNQIDMRLLPCLFERQHDGRLYVITGFSGTQIIAFCDGNYERLDMASANFKGTAYFFTRETLEAGENRNASRTGLPAPCFASRNHSFGWFCRHFSSMC